MGGGGGLSENKVGWGSQGAPTKPHPDPLTERLSSHSCLKNKTKHHPPENFTVQRAHGTNEMRTIKGESGKSQVIRLETSVRPNRQSRSKLKHTGNTPHFKSERRVRYSTNGTGTARLSSGKYKTSFVP